MLHDRRLLCICFGIFCFVCIFLIFSKRTRENYVWRENSEQPYAQSYQLLPGNATWYLDQDMLPDDDKTRLINITDFEFLINTPCLSSLYVVVVHSAPYNFDKRNIIRNTWGTKVPVYFFIGESLKINQTQLDKEAYEFNDIVQGKFQDSYRNLTYKHAMELKWTVYYCNNVKYVLKIDDDVFVNTFVLSEYLKHNLSINGARNLLMCTKIEVKGLAERSYRSKWRVSYDEYANRYYPPYCWGFVVLYSPDILFKLYQLIQTKNEYFWIDDVFITGILFDELNTTHVQFNNPTSSFWEQDPRWVSVYDDMNVYNPNNTLFGLVFSPNYTMKYEYLYNITLTHHMKQSLQERNKLLEL